MLLTRKHSYIWTHKYNIAKAIICLYSVKGVKGKRIIVNFKTLPKSLEMEMRSTQLTSNKQKYKNQKNLNGSTFIILVKYVFLVEYH